VGTAIGRTGLRARLTVAGCGALAVLGTLILSACTPSGGTPTATVSSFTITAPAANTAGASALPNSGSTTVTVTPTQTTTTTVTPAVNPAPNPASSAIPDQAPAAGGGGTAGLQDGLLLALGAAAIVAGAGALAYRRRLTRNR
jgi:hypothetical protein